VLFSQTEDGILDLQTGQVHETKMTINLCHRFRQPMYHERIFSNNCDDDIATYLYIYSGDSGADSIILTSHPYSTGFGSPLPLFYPRPITYYSK